MLFSRTDLVYAALKSDEVKEDTEAPPIPCEILEKKKKNLKGICSAYGSCVMGSVQYFGYFCHGLLTGDPCTVETTEYVTVAGVCTEMGTCVTPQRGVRFRHLSCLNNADMDREEGMDMGMNMKKNPVADMVKHVDRNRGITRKEAINVKYVRNENNE